MAAILSRGRWVKLMNVFLLKTIEISKGCTERCRYEDRKWVPNVLLQNEKEQMELVIEVLLEESEKGGIEKKC